jgi:hypothetical protein
MFSPYPTHKITEVKATPKKGGEAKRKDKSPSGERTEVHWGKEQKLRRRAS